jgi:hypothetical protein
VARHRRRATDRHSRGPADDGVTEVTFSTRWYDVAATAEMDGARAVVQLRRRDGVRPAQFRRFANEQLVAALTDTGVLKELGTQI